MVTGAVECFYDSPPMPATVSKSITRLSSLIFFFAGPTSLCGRYCKCKSITHFFFSIWPPVAVNFLYFLAHVIDGLGGGYRRNTQCYLLFPM